jgi:hypothetical protein
MLGSPRQSTAVVPGTYQWIRERRERQISQMRPWRLSYLAVATSFWKGSLVRLPFIKKAVVAEAHI